MSVNKFPNTKCNSCGNKNKNITKALLTCNHAICHNCIDKDLRQLFGDNLEIVSIDKKQMFDNSCDKEYRKMILGTENTSGILPCPKCNESYSILHATFREYGLPMKIKAIVEFEHENKIITHHLCTSLDLIHLLHRDKQAHHLSIYEYNGIDQFDHTDIDEIKNYDSSISKYHVVKVNDSYELQNSETCSACLGTHEHYQFDDFLRNLTPP